MHLRRAIERLTPTIHRPWSGGRTGTVAFILMSKVAKRQQNRRPEGEGLNPPEQGPTRAAHEKAGCQIGLAAWERTSSAVNT